MSDLTKFSEGASLLQQVDVSDIFKNLAMGIAEAQQKLDDNSIAQAIKLAETQINGVSLLELGFAPVFYAFQYADISASINLQMALKESLEFGFGLEIELATKKGYSEDNRKFMSEDNYSETEKEYKTSRDLNFQAGERNAVTIENKIFTLKEDLKAKSRIEGLKEDIYERATHIDQIYDEISSNKLTENQSRGVDVWVDNGYLRVEEGLNYKQTGIGVLKITDYAGNTGISVDGTGVDDFNLQTNFQDSLTEATNDTGTIYGLSKSGDLYVYESPTWKPISSKFYFAYNRDEITFGKDLNHGNGEADLTYASPISSSFNNMNHNEHMLIHRVLRLIQRNDPKAVITITGVTDPKGGDNPQNQSLAKRRAEKLRSHIFGTGTQVNVIAGAVTNPSGESSLLERYAKVELNADYIIFIDGLVKKDAKPAKTEVVANKFVYADDSIAGQFDKLQVKYGSNTLSYSVNESGETFTTLVQYVKGAISENSYEMLDTRHYFLEDQSIVKFHLYTNQSEEIQIEHEDESTSEGTEHTNTFMASKTRNEKSLLSDSLNKKSQDNSFALGASVDFRMSRQFEMSLEGNASMSARLVAVPAPSGFVVFLQNVYVNQTTEE